jgi:chemotaxis protein CheC
LPYSHALDEIELDALTELVNIGVSRAAGALRQMVGEQVHLSVPSVTLMTRSQAALALSGLADGALVAVREEFTGGMTGQALLVLSQAKTSDLVRAVTGNVLLPDHEMHTLEDEALSETGNVILSNCLSTIANMLQQHLRISLPSIVRGTGAAVLDALVPSPHEVILFQHINFSVRSRDIKGAIILLIDVASLQILKSLIAEFIDRALGAGANLATGSRR